MTTEFQGFQDMMTRRSKEEALFSELFYVMKKIDGLKQVIEKHRTNPEEVYSLANRISCFVGYYQGDYLPVSLVSFASSLDYLLSEKDALLNYSEREAMAVIKVAITKM